MNPAQRETPPAPPPALADDLVVRPFQPDTHWFYRLAQFCIGVFARLWTRLEIQHRERVPRDGPFILLANHASFLDPPYVGHAISREMHFLAREGILKAPLIGWLTYHLNTHPIRRGGSDRQAIRICRAILQAGWPLVFFPEGTRSATGRIGTIHGGYVTILEGFPDIPILPVIVQGSHEALPRGALIPRPRKVRIVVGEPTLLPVRREGESTREYHRRCNEDLERRWRLLGAQ